MFPESILIFTTVFSSKPDEHRMEKRIITRKERLVESRRSEITDQKLSKRLKVDMALGQKLKIKR